MEKLGFIGMGNMAQALCDGFIKSGAIAQENVFAYAPHYDKLLENAGKIGFVPVKTLEELLAAADTFIMACKPYQVSGVLKEGGAAFSGKTIISIAAGLDYQEYYKMLVSLDPYGINKQDRLPLPRVQYVIPNTPAMVGAAVSMFESDNTLLPEEREEIKALFGSVGRIAELPAKLMGAGMAVASCGTAFVDMFMEAYADAAVKYGVPRAQAYELVGQTVLGAAKLMLETGEHPGVLKDNVCSPGGTTIKGVAALEKAGFRDACISSIDAVLGGK